MRFTSHTSPLIKPSKVAIPRTSKDVTTTPDHQQPDNFVSTNYVVNALNCNFIRFTIRSD